MDRRFAFLALVLSLQPAVSWAQVETASYVTEKDEQVLGLEAFDFDSDWLPQDSPIQVRLIAHGDNTVYVGMTGEGLYNWDHQEISFEGLPGGGEFAVDFGIDVQSQVRFDLLGIQWEGDLMDPILYGVFESILFDPYLLPGDPSRPGVLEGSIPPETVVDVPLGIDLIVASGNFQLAIGADIYAELEGNSITVESETETAIVDAWDLAVSLGADPSSPLDLWATLESHLYFEITITLYPSVVLSVLGNDFTLAEIDVPIEVPPLDDTWIFDPVALSFAAPPPPNPGGGTQGTGGDGDVASTTFTDCGCGAVPGSQQQARSGLFMVMSALLFLRRRVRRCSQPIESQDASIQSFR